MDINRSKPATDNSRQHGSGSDKHRWFWISICILLIGYLAYDISELVKYNDSRQKQQSVQAETLFSDKTEHIYKIIDGINPELDHNSKCNIAESIVWASEEDKIDPYLVLSIAIVESSIKTDAKSPTGVEGIMQVTKTTARQMAKSIQLSRSDINLRNPSHNIQLGVKYLRYLMDMFPTKKAIQAYNVGEGAVLKDPTSGRAYQEKVSAHYKRILTDLLPLVDSGYNVY